MIITQVGRKISVQEKKKENEERKRIEIAEAWDSIIFAQMLKSKSNIEIDL